MLRLGDGLSCFLCLSMEGYCLKILVLRINPWNDKIENKERRASAETYRMSADIIGVKTKPALF